MVVWTCKIAGPNISTNVISEKFISGVFLASSTNNNSLTTSLVVVLTKENDALVFSVTPEILPRSTISNTLVF